MGELPRPPFDSPIIASNPLFTNWGSSLYTLGRHTRLQDFMCSSGLAAKLRDIGHTWLWHEEVFQWLFLERVISNSRATSLDCRAFDLVFRRAQAEIARNSFRIRRITMLNGLPRLNRIITLGKNIQLSPIEFSTHHYELADLLGWRFQDRNRAPSFWISPDDCLLIQDSIITKGNEGKELLEYRKQAKNHTEVVIRSLKLSLDTPIYPKAVYSSYLSSFPLLPISHTEFEEYSEISISVGTPLARPIIQNIRKYFNFMQAQQTQTVRESGFFDTALDRFADSFRIRQVERSAVDLVVALDDDDREIVISRPSTGQKKIYAMQTHTDGKQEIEQSNTAED